MGGTRLAVPPSSRYERAVGGSGPVGGDGPAGGGEAGGLATSQRPEPRGAIVRAGAAGALGALALTGLVVIFAATTGTILVSGLTGAAMGLLIATAAVPSHSGGAAALERDEAVRLAVGMAVGAVIVAAGLIWIAGRLEGGVMDPVTYLWTTFGLGFPALAAVAALAAAWGASNGPVRG